MSVLIYANGKWNSLVGNSIYSSRDGKWHTIGDFDKLYVNNQWYKIGYDIISQAQSDITFDIEKDSVIPGNNRQILYFSPNGNGNMDGSSWSNAYGFSSINSVLESCNQYHCLYFMSGEYELKQPIHIPFGVNFYGGFPQSGQWNLRNPFLYKTVFKPQSNLDDNNKIFIRSGSNSVGSQQVIDGLYIEDFRDAFVQCSSGLTLKNSVISNLTNGRLQCNAQNCKIQNSFISMIGVGKNLYVESDKDFYIEGGLYNSKITLTDGDFTFDNSDNIDSTDTIFYSSNYPNSNLYFIDTCVLSVSGQCNISAIRNSIISNVNIAIVNCSYKNIYYHTGVDIDDSQYDKMIFGDDSKYVDIDKATNDEFSQRVSLKNNQGLGGNYSTVIVDASQNILDSSNYDYVSAKGAVQNYGNSSNSLIIIDNQLYYGKDLVKCQSYNEWSQITGYTTNVSQTINSTNGTDTIINIVAYGINNGSLYSIRRNYTDQQLNSGILENSNIDKFILNIANNNGGTWTCISGFSSSTRIYNYKNTLDYKTLDSQTINYAYGICGRKLYAFNGQFNTNDNIDISKNTFTNTSIYPTGVFLLSDKQGWTKVCGFSTCYHNSSGVSYSNYAYAICDGVLYSIRGLTVTKIGVQSAYNWTDISGYSDGSSIFAYGICGGVLYVLNGNTASKVTTNITNWKKVCGYYQQNSSKNNNSDRDYTLTSSFIHGIGITYDNKLYKLNHYSVQYIDVVDSYVGSISYKYQKVVSNYNVTSQTYTNNGSLFIIKNNKIYVLKLKNSSYYKLQQIQICNYYGDQISLFEKNSVILNNNNGSGIKNASKCKFYNCENIYVTESSNSLFVNCQNDLVTGGVYGGTYNSIYSMNSYTQSCYSSSNESYCIINGKLYYSNNLDICDDGSQGWLQVSGYYDQENSIYGYGIKDNKLYLLKGTNASLIDDNGVWNTVSGYFNKIKETDKLVYFIGQDDKKLYANKINNEDVITSKILINDSYSWQQIIQCGKYCYGIASGKLFIIKIYDIQLLSQQSDWIYVGRSTLFDVDLRNNESSSSQSSNSSDSSQTLYNNVQYLYALRGSYDNNHYYSNSIYKLGSNGVFQQIVIDSNTKFNNIISYNNLLCGLNYQYQKIYRITSYSNIEISSSFSYSVLSTMDVDNFILQNIQSIDYNFGVYKQINGVGIRDGLLYIISSNAISLVNSAIQFKKQTGYVQYVYVYYKQNNIYSKQFVYNKFNCYASSFDNILYEINYEYSKKRMDDIGQILKIEYNNINKNYYMIKNNKLFRLQSNGIIEINIENIYDENEQSSPSSIEEGKELKWIDFAFNKDGFYGLTSEGVYIIQVDDATYINNSKGITKLFSLNNSNYIYCINNSKLASIKGEQYSVITNGFNEWQRVFQLCPFGNDLFLMMKKQIFILCSISNFSTYAGCIGKLRTGYCNIYWNCDGYISPNENGQSKYDSLNLITFEFDEYGNSNNDIVKFMNIGYSGSKGKQNISSCPMINKVKNGDVAYQQWIDSFGDFHISNKSKLMEQSNKINQQFIYGSTAYSTDLDGFTRVVGSTLIGAYQYNEQKEQSYQVNNGILNVMNMANVSNNVADFGDNDVIDDSSVTIQ